MTTDSAGGAPLANDLQGKEQIVKKAFFLVVILFVVLGCGSSRTVTRLEPETVTDVSGIRTLPVITAVEQVWASETLGTITVKLRARGTWTDA